MESLGVDIKLLIAQTINFALFFYIFKKFISHPFSQFLKTEVDKEKEKEKILEEVKKKEEVIILEEKKAKERIKKEYETALKQAKEEAAKIKQKLIAEAKAEAEQIITKGRKQIEEERETMNKEIKKKAVDLSLLIIERVLGQFISLDIQKKINQQILKNFSKKIE